MKKNRICITLVTFVVVAALTYFSVSASAAPGDATDPLVTRRYVDERITQLTAEISALRAQMGLAPGPSAPNQPINQTERDALFADMMIYFETVYGEMLRAAMAGVGTTDPHSAVSAVVPFEPLFVPAGHRLVAEAGVELIVRSGQAIAVSGPDGMVNVTAGRDVTNGEQVPHNNLLLVPRTDGRGLHFVTDSWLMIKGRYEIVN